jgi:glycosyltransferase involved in cell wall biosynthesis
LISPEKKNILVLTSCYPSEDLQNTTSIVHYFAKEWAKDGHEVRVIHNHTIFPSFYYILSGFLRVKILKYINNRVNLKWLPRVSEYSLDGIKIIRLPIFKIMPRGRFSKKSISKQVEKIIEYNLRSSFSPNIIVSHWANPQLELSIKLKEYYHIKASLVLHDKSVNYYKIFKNDFYHLVQKIDFLGYRSLALKSTFEKLYGEQKDSFICSSGIPDFFFDDTVKNKSYADFNKFVFVGGLIKRKNPLIIITALQNAFNREVYRMEYIGDGHERKSIEKLIRENKLNDQVKIIGHIGRNAVKTQLLESDCFIMVSENETFGLVYLEAMATGCITICTKNEGMDGIIIDGINGFLCDANDLEMLTSIILNVRNMSEVERKKIAHSAIETARGFLDSFQAKMYIQNISKINIHE